VGVHHLLERPKPCSHLRFDPLLRLGGEIIRIEVHQVVVLDAIGRRVTVPQVPAVWPTAPDPRYHPGQLHLTSHRQDGLGSGVLRQRMLQVLRLPVKVAETLAAGLSHGSQLWFGTPSNIGAVVRRAADELGMAVQVTG